MRMNPVFRRGLPESMRGVSLVEVMIGLVVGLIASLVVIRSFTASDMFRRNIGNTADAAQTVAISAARLNALFEQAGGSFVQGRNIWGCSLKAKRNGATLLPASTAYPAPFTSFPTAVRVLPVGILDGGTGSDILMVMAGSSPSANRGIAFSTSDGSTLLVSNPNGVAIGASAGSSNDLLLSVPQDLSVAPGDCQVVQVASNYSSGLPVTDASFGYKVMPASAAVVAPASYSSIRLNSASTSYGLLPTSISASSPSIFPLGAETASTFSLLSVNTNGELVEYDLLQRRGAEPFGENVILIKARYGVDDGVGGTPNDNVVDEWVSPADSEWTLAKLTDGKTATEQKIDQIKAIRIGVIVRTPQVVVSNTKPTTLVLFADLPAARQVSRTLSTDEQKYGYQVFDWVIPLRNMKATPK
ncbi:MAG: PilW family protein [Proteobacteria bacterium]|nr:PilW family protein [Pseudomonadota bacterium]